VRSRFSNVKQLTRRLSLAFFWRSFVTSRPDACYFAIARQGLSTPLRPAWKPMNRSPERILAKNAAAEEPFSKGAMEDEHQSAKEKSLIDYIAGFHYQDENQTIRLEAECPWAHS
jgi:hypothetical protein